jgi:hypothetical protein
VLIYHPFSARIVTKAVQVANPVTSETTVRYEVAGILNNLTQIMSR